jgi:hypothetical protein
LPVSASRIKKLTRSNGPSAAASAGAGLIPSRDNDCFGVGYYYNSTRRSGSPACLGFECFYNIAITPAAHLTLDLQVVDSPQERPETATVLGLRASLEF